MTLSRRTLGKSALALVGGAFLGMPQRAALAAEDVQLRMSWWGGQDRARRTNAALRLFESSHPGVHILGESVGWGDYWPKLATLVAGGNGPDIIQQDYRFLAEYARRGALLPLDGFMPKPLDLADFAPGAEDAGRVDGKLYGVSLGLNSTATIYDAELLGSLKLPEPDYRWSWDEFARLAVEIGQASKGSVAGTGNHGGFEPAFEVYVRQRGKALYTADGKLAFAPEDAAEWFAFWDKLRRAGGTVTPNVQALDKGSVDTSPLTLKKAAIVMSHSNLLLAYQSVNKHRLGITMNPWGAPGTRPGQYLKQAMMASAYAKTKSPELAAAVIDFLIRDPAAIAVLEIERGVPAAAAAREAVAGKLDDVDRRQLDYITLARDHMSPLPPTPPKGAGEIEDALTRTNDAVSFERLAVKDAARQFCDEARQILTRS